MMIETELTETQSRMLNILPDYKYFTKEAMKIGFSSYVPGPGYAYYNDNIRLGEITFPNWDYNKPMPKKIIVRGEKEHVALFIAAIDKAIKRVEDGAYHQRR